MANGWWTGSWLSLCEPAQDADLKHDSPRMKQSYGNRLCGSTAPVTATLIWVVALAEYPTVSSTVSVLKSVVPRTVMIASTAPMVCCCWETMDGLVSTATARGCCYAPGDRKADSRRRWQFRETNSCSRNVPTRGHNKKRSWEGLETHEPLLLLYSY